MRRLLIAPVLHFAQRLRFPWLFALTAGLLALDVLVPDPLPLIDEIVLALGTLLLASCRRRKSGPHDPY